MTFHLQIKTLVRQKDEERKISLKKKKKNTFNIFQPLYPLRRTMNQETWPIKRKENHS